MNRAARRRHRYYQRTLGIKDRRGQRYADRINANGGNGYGLLYVWLRRHTGLGLAMICALGQQESAHSNVFGNDPVTPPQIRGGPVTRARYLAYRTMRRRGLGMQGVSLFQLTWFTYQDDADKLGGCWRPRFNGLVACRHLRTLIRIHGEARGCMLYNGSGPAAERYSRALRAKRDAWRRTLFG